MHLLDYFNPDGPPTALFEIGPPSERYAAEGYSDGYYVTDAFCCAHATRIEGPMSKAAAERRAAILNATEQER